MRLKFLKQSNKKEITFKAIIIFFFYKNSNKNEKIKKFKPKNKKIYL